MAFWVLSFWTIPALVDPLDPRMIAILVLTSLPMVVDGTSQYLDRRMSNNPLRLVTGLLFGFAGMALLLVLRRAVFPLGA